MPNQIKLKIVEETQKKMKILLVFILKVYKVKCEQVTNLRKNSKKALLNM